MVFSDMYYGADSEDYMINALHGILWMQSAIYLLDETVRSNI